MNTWTDSHCQPVHADVQDSSTSEVELETRQPFWPTDHIYVRRDMTIKSSNTLPELTVLFS